MGPFVDIRKVIGTLDNSEGLFGTLEMGPFLDIRNFVGTLDNSEALGLGTLNSLTGLLGTLENLMRPCCTLENL